ncbi:MAG: YaaL family protein [Oscillospiraceae bacterium]|nr:YaaL family protein [Oscillospiraceae bacterium]
MNEIWHEIAEAKEELSVAMANFNQAIDNDVIDYWIYRIKSAQTKYDLLMNEVRRANDVDQAAV